MSPNGDTDAAGATGAQPRALAGNERAGSLEGRDEEVKDDEPKKTQEKLLEVLTGLAERMQRLEASQERREAEEKLKEQQSSVFGSSLGQEMAMNRRALASHLHALVHRCYHRLHTSVCVIQDMQNPP